MNGIYWFSCQALDLKKLQTPLYEEFYNTVNAGNSQGVDQTSNGKFTNSPKLPPRGKSPPSKMRGGPAAATPCDSNLNSTVPESCSKQFSRDNVDSSRILREIASPQLNELGDKVHIDVQDSTRFVTYIRPCFKLNLYSAKP